MTLQAKKFSSALLHREQLGLSANELPGEDEAMQIPYEIMPRRHARRRMTSPTGAIKPSLSTRARTLLLRRYASLRSKTRLPSDAITSKFTKMGLLRVAEHCSRAELLNQPGVGPVTVSEIENWLAAHGKSFRSDPSKCQTALGQAIAHIEAMLEARDEQAFFTAFVALPELRRSLNNGALE